MRYDISLLWFGYAGWAALDTKDPKRAAKAVHLARVMKAAPTGRSVLVERLASCLDAARARVLVDDVLERTGRTEVPDDPDELLSFVKAHLIDDLVAAVGARAVSGFLEDLRDSARLISGVHTRDSQPGRAVIALVDRDHFRRAGTARLLLARSLEVAVASKLEELFETPLRPDVLILEHDEALSAALFVVLSQPRFRPAIVLRTHEPGAAMEILERAGVDHYEIVATSVPADVVGAVERLLAP